MIRLYLLRRELADRQKLKLLPLQRVPFAGATAYLINAHSKDKVLALLAEKPLLDAPYDLALRQLVYQSRLKALVTFPFLTSLSPAADVSQIQPGDETKIADLAWNAFRRTMWGEGSVREAVRSLDRIANDYFDPECQVFSRILSCMLAVNFKPK
jgi:hypothetical protein